MTGHDITFVSAGTHAGSARSDDDSLWPQDRSGYGLSSSGTGIGYDLSLSADPAAFLGASVAVARASPAAAYSYTFSYTGAIVTFTVPVTGIYDITAYGGQGASYAARDAGGLGADIGSNIALTQGTQILVLVGGGGHGGGGTFIVEEANGVLTPLVIAGGGGAGGASGNG
ncbi:MAG: hypothetical protein ACRYG8_22190, partial [Janthinobacterium lividum]